MIADRYNSLVQGNIIGLNAAATVGNEDVGNTTGVLITNGYNLIGDAESGSGTSFQNAATA